MFIKILLTNMRLFSARLVLNSSKYVFFWFDLVFSLISDLKLKFKVKSGYLQSIVYFSAKIILTMT